MKIKTSKKIHITPRKTTLPLALAAGACGGGNNDTSDSENGSRYDQPILSITYSEPLDFLSLSADLDVPDNYQENWNIRNVSGASEYYYAIMMSPNLVYSTNSQDSDIVVLPSWFNYGPFLPAVSLSVDANNKIYIASTNEAAEVGWARNWAEITVSGRPMMIVADHGHEYPTSKDTWLKGDLWLVEPFSGGDFSLTAISGPNAFYHDVTVGDLNDDGLDDIVGINMSFVNGADPYNLHAFLQNQDGTFTQQMGFMSFADDLPMIGPSAGELVDVDGDGVDELIYAAYRIRDFGGWDTGTAFRVFDKQSQGEFENVFNGVRSGKAQAMGVTNIHDVDIDGDGDLDLIFQLEGSGGDGTVSDISGDTTSSKGAIQIWENVGDYEFIEVTDNWLDISVWTNREFSIRDLTVTDLNGDGYIDIFLNGFGPNIFQDYGEIDLGSYIFMNRGGEYFEHMNDKQELIFSVTPEKAMSHMRYYQQNIDSFELIITNHDNTFGIIEVNSAVL